MDPVQFFSNSQVLATTTIALLVALLSWSLLLLQRSLKVVNTVALPGPRALPIIGHLHLLGKEPHKSLLELSKKHGPIMFLRLGSVPTVVASSTQVALEFLKTNDKACASRPDMAARRYINPDSISWADYGARFRSMRRVCVMEMLTPKRVDAAREIRAAEISHMLCSMLEDSKQSIKMMTKLTVLSMNVITQMAMRKSYFGPLVTSAEADQFKAMIHEFFTLVGATNIGDYIPFLSWLDVQGYERRMRRLNKEFDKFLEAIVEEHREKKNGAADEESLDFVDVLLRAASSEEEHFGGGTIKALIQDMIVAGTESTSSTIEWSLVELLSKPSTLEKAQEELDRVVGRERRVTEDDVPKLKYLQAIVSEVLRLHPPGPLMLPHEATEDCMVSGYHIPKKTRIMVNLHAIFRDPSTWSNPLEFNPDRFMDKREEFTVTAFGAGRRMCPGSPLGLATAHISLANLLQCFNWKKGAQQGVPLEAFVTPRLPHELISA